MEFKKGDKIESKDEVEVIVHKKIKGVVDKVEEQAFGKFVYFTDEYNQKKCFKIDSVININNIANK